MRILFAATPASGHVTPLLALVRMVRRRGDDALFVTGSHLSGLVESAGATFLPLAEGADLDFRDIEKLFPERAALPPGMDQLRFDFERVFIDTMVPQAATLRAAIAMHAPDLVVTDSTFLGRVPLMLDRKRSRPPIAACGVTALSLARPDGAPFGPGLPPARSEADRETYAGIAASVDEKMTRPTRTLADAELAALGLPALPCSVAEAFVLLADTYMHATVPAFEYPFGPLPDHVRFIGALPPSPRPDLPRPDWWDELDGSRPVVLVTQGTVSNADFGQLVEPALAALADRDDLLVLVTTGGRPLDGIKGPVPRNARLATFLDLEVLLPRIDVLVTNGGYGTVSQALRCGKPIVAAGRTEDKAEVGARVGWSGVGIEIPSQTPTASELRAATLQVLARPDYRRRAAAIAAEMAAIDTHREVLATFDGLAAHAGRERVHERVA